MSPKTAPKAPNGLTTSIGTTHVGRRGGGRGRGKPLLQGILGKEGFDGTAGASKPPVAQRAGGTIPPDE